MPLSIKVNLRVTGHCNQGGRKYMEDMFSVAYQQTSDDKDLEYAFFGIFDGHGGGEAATFAKEHLMDIIVKQRNFWSDKDEDVLRAIRDGYVNTHYAMWRELDKWPTTASGLPSTAGTTASVAFIRKGKIYIGHVGDSGIILGYQEEGDPQWKAKALTKDHKPESGSEMTRIQESGGKVVSKSGVPRVVWNRPRIGHKGPVRRSTHIDEIPFLAVARSLGDLWSYNSELDTFVVSPEPDVKVVTVDVKSQRCLIFGTDGLWNMLTPQAAVAIVQSAERHNEKHLIASQQTGNGQADVQMWINPSKSLVDTALERWFSTRLRADNTSVVTLMLDPPGPSRSEVLMSRKNERAASPKSVTPVTCPRTPSTRVENPIEPLERPITSTLPKDDAPELKKPDTSENSKKSSIVNEKCDAIADSPKKSSDDDRITEKKNEPEVTLASTSRESIQVPEISSSDAFVENQESPIVETNNDIVETTEQSSITNNNENQEISTNDTTKVSRNITPDIKVAMIEEKSAEKCPVSKNKDGLSPLVRQNAFCGSCEELQSRPRLRRSLGPFGTVNRPLNRDTGKEQKEPMSGLPSRRKSQSVTTINSHLESRSVRRRQSVNSTTVSYIADRQKSYFSARLKRDSLGITRSIDTIHDNKRTTANTKITAKINSKINDTIVGSKRRHSSTSERPEEPVRTIPEPTAKRRTRSEDRPGPTDENDPANQSKQSQQQQQQQQQQQHSRLRWPEDSISSLRSRSGSTSTSCVATSVTNQEKIPSPNSYQRRSLEKKATPVKTIRRPSINGSSRPQLRGSFALREWDQSKNGRRNSCSNHARLNRTVPGVVGSTSDSSSSSSTSPLPSLQRWLRSDTLAATPVKTLRSRNVDITGHTVPPQIAYQYDIVKPNRLSLSSKIKLNGAKVGKPTSGSMSTGKLNKQSVNGAVVANGIDVVTTTTTTTTNTTMSSSGTSSVIAKRVKSPYNANARSALGTRSRLKRLGK